jgi:hypothetical protein
MVPVAPGLLSVMTVWPSRSCIFGPMARATVSVEPPGGKGTTSVIGLAAGQACPELVDVACACALPAALASAMARRESKDFMGVSPGSGASPGGRLERLGSATVCGIDGSVTTAPIQAVSGTQIPVRGSPGQPG